MAKYWQNGEWHNDQNDTVDSDEEQEEIIHHLSPDDDITTTLSDSEYRQLIKEEPDTINPAYYRQGTMECIDAIEGLNLSFHEAQVLKYITRWRLKGGREDLLKAQWYLNRLLDRAVDI